LAKRSSSACCSLRNRTIDHTFIAPADFRNETGYSASILLRDRDRIFGASFVEQVNAFGTRQVLATPRSPGQRAYVERVIGTIRRECLDYVIVFDERDLRHWLRVFIAHYHQTRTHLALGKDVPEPRPMQSRDEGRVVSISEVGGLHHRYQRPAA
jgi:putative transposase